jgi:hypothetical protein
MSLSLKFLSEQQNIIYKNINQNSTCTKWDSLMTVINAENTIMLCLKYLESGSIDNEPLTICQIHKLTFYKKIYEMSKAFSIEWSLIYKDMEELAVFYAYYYSAFRPSNNITFKIVLNIFEIANKISLVCVKKHYMKLFEKNAFYFMKYKYAE